MMIKRETTGLFTDFYELTMAQAYFLSGKIETSACFEYYFRTNPFQSGFAVFAGLQELIQQIKTFRYSDLDIQYLRSLNFDEKFLHHLLTMEMTIDVTSMHEGEIIFGNEPIVRFNGNLIQLQLIETAVLNCLNFNTLIATKAFRIAMAAKGKPIAEFGLRRAQGLGGLWASKAAAIGGVQSTSNTMAGEMYQLPVSGTMAHAWVQSHDTEIESFRIYAKYNQGQVVFLVDTYDTLKSGVPNAIIVAKELKREGKQLHGIRLDSGDLAYLSKKARIMLDDAGLHHVKIIASNQINEYILKSLNDQNAPIDAYGVGTELVTGKPDASLDGVYKLVEIDGVPKMKFSNNPEKTTLPSMKTVIRYTDDSGLFVADGIHRMNEKSDDWIHHPNDMNKKMNTQNLKNEQLLHNYIQKGEVISEIPSIEASHQYLLNRYEKLPCEIKRYTNPHIYKVGVSKEILSERDSILKNLRSINSTI